MLRYLSKFLYVLPAKRSSLIILTLLFVSVSLLETFGIGLIGPFINLASDPNIIYQKAWLNWIYVYSGLKVESQFIALIGFVIVILFCVKSYVSWRVQSYVFIFSSKQKVKLTTKLVHAYLFAPYTFHLSKNSSSIIQNVINETNHFFTSLSTLLTAASNTIVIFCLAVLLFLTNSIALIVLLFLTIPLFWLLDHFKSKVLLWGKELSESNEEIIRQVNHGLGGIKETQIIGCGLHFENQIAKQAEIYSNASGAFYSFKLSPRILIETILVIFLVGFTSVFLIFTQQDVGELTSVLSIFALASFRLIPAFTNLANGINQLRSSSYAINKIYFELKDLEAIEKNRFSELLIQSNSTNKFINNSNSDPEITFTTKIVLDRVSYSYPNTTGIALDSISLTIPKGQSIALIGKSGAGKTTLVDVILGLLIPQTGNIIVDGRSVYDNLRSWQNLIGYIPQSIYLTDNTIEKNIAFGVPEHLIDQQKLNKAIKAAQLAEVIEALPDGLKTMVGERGVRLSGGQRQRVGIARALYHEREILVLDEATAALDNETESLVTEAIKSLSGTKTMIIIAHRLTTVEHCDRIYMMYEGRIVKSGTYKEVVLEQQYFHNSALERTG
ncbi:ABC transporter ATP-binding protein [Pleurocapsales cyanobacterium LEGE 06147]|nr:ABC transporter ATP-binding protein [Pleurocapsales cyanobacterium LEGE 06147]